MYGIYFEMLWKVYKGLKRKRATRNEEKVGVTLNSIKVIKMPLF